MLLKFINRILSRTYSPFGGGPRGRTRLINQKLPASSIAEVVIALTIIALCFSVAALIFIRSMNVTSRFQDVRKQTEIQSKIIESLYKENDSIPFIEEEDVEVTVTQDENNDSLNTIDFLADDNRLIWKIQSIKK